MSETQHYRGKLIQLANGLHERTLSIKAIAKDHNVTEVPSGYEDWDDYIQYEFYGEYVIINGVLYKVEKKDVGDQDVFVAEKTEEGYDFEVAYYDGGMSLDEALTEAIGNANA